MITEQERYSALRQALEEQFEQQTDELTRLTAYSDDPERNGYDRHGIVARIAATRQTLAETTEALRRIAEGTYGRCERCQTEIPVERLEIRPHARYCVPCQKISGS
jgi:RNA polymerase-binding transcription factor DksA